MSYSSCLPDDKSLISPSWMKHQLILMFSWDGIWTASETWTFVSSKKSPADSCDLEIPGPAFLFLCSPLSSSGFHMCHDVSCTTVKLPVSLTRT